MKNNLNTFCNSEDGFFAAFSTEIGMFMFTLVFVCASSSSPLNQISGQEFRLVPSVQSSRKWLSCYLKWHNFVEPRKQQ